MTDLAAPAPPRSVPVLTDGVVTLRAQQMSDADELTALARDPATVSWTSVPTPYRRSDALDRVRAVEAGWCDGSMFCWTIEAPDDGRARFAGQVELRTGPPPDVGFGLAPWARGRGFMTRALRLAADWGFDVAGFPVLQWSAMVDNWTSWRVAHACGFAFEGTRTLAHPSRDGLVDSWHAVLRPDPQRPVAGRTPVTTWWPVPVLVGDRVRLRPHAEADLPRIVEACSDPRARYWNATLAHPYGLDDARSFVRRLRLQESLGQAVTWAVADPGDDRLLANITVFGLDRPYAPDSGEVGYWAHPDARGRGVVTEAVRMVREHAFTPVADGGLGRTRLQLGTSWDNTASRHVAERNGFRLVGHFRRDGVAGVDNELVHDGAWYDLLHEDG
ncbi:GNAT family N-acetyltransferase [Pseudonocardia sp. KRD291]|uniref:GNAT family N-acetyltransferase n=1 Tax=Pseudonocardia sp. KRD291 TaxID=2792007 RepID=UPI001C49D766|nr:GNAT family N-acetyltransferase [Pseudonocardia sp. KRD291]MBW0102323.1 GNAT family N-acetyltransferase [Pseudonocardia sp. KRD291]